MGLVVVRAETAVPACDMFGPGGLRDWVPSITSEMPTSDSARVADGMMKLEMVY